MTYRAALIATVIATSAVITACSNVTGPSEKIQPPEFAGIASFAVSSTTCPIQGTGLPGALNMLHDPTMFTTPMARDADKGNAGMFHAVAVSGC